MYIIMRFISAMVRLFVLPNPFENSVYQICIPLGNGIAPMNFVIPPFYINLVIEPVLSAFTYMIVGIYYRSRSCPALGSLLYLLFYAIHVTLLYLIGVFHWQWLAIFIILLTYIGLHVLVAIFHNLYIRRSN